MDIHRIVLVAIITVSCGLCFSAEPNQSNWRATGKNGAVVAGKPGSASAGLAVLRQGGNAADAAAATIFALSVTDAASACFGGEVPIIVYDAKRNVVEVIAGMGTAPRLAALDYFERAGGIKGGTAQSAAVPAVLDACITLLDRYGTMTFTQVVDPTLKLLDKGGEKWHADLTRTLRRLVEAEKPTADRRQGLRLVADYFYRGPIARELDAWSTANAGLIRYTDLATHVTRIEQPVSADYRGCTVYKCDAWTQGPYLLETLNLLEGFDLKGMGFQSPQTIHVIVEAMKLALADRDTWYADPLFENVPLRQLLSEEYTLLRRQLIDMNVASTALRPGDPYTPRVLLDEKTARAGVEGADSDTSTCLVADKWGNVIAATPSGWGGVLAGDTGVWFGSRLISFNLWKNHPNHIEPGKRPRITLTPTLVFKDGKPVLAVSVAGGDTQDQASIQIVTDFIDFGLPADKLVSTARYATEHYIGSFSQTPPVLAGLTIGPQFGPDCLQQLQQWGHILNPKAPKGHVPQDRTVLVMDHKKRVLYVAGDPNADSPRTAAAF